MHRVLLAVAAAFSLSFLVLACSDEDAADSGRTRGNFEAEVEEQLRSIDGRIRELENEVRLQGGGIDDEAKDRLEDLNGERIELEEQLARLRNSHDDDWKNVKEDIEKGLKDLEGSVDDLENDLDSLLN